MRNCLPVSAVTRISIIMLEQLIGQEYSKQEFKYATKVFVGPATNAKTKS